MTHIHCIDRVAMPGRPAAASNPARPSHAGPAALQRCPARLASCAFAAASLVLSGGAAMAGCASGSHNPLFFNKPLTHSSCQASADGSGATAVGFEASANYNLATALGRGSEASAQGSTSVGPLAKGRAVWSTAIGAGDFFNWVVAAQAQKPYSIAIGGGINKSNRGAIAMSGYSIAIGTGALAWGEGSVAVGAFAGADTHTSPSNSTLGSEAGRSVSGSGNSAFGQQSGSEVSGGSNSAFGGHAGRNVTGNNNTAAGLLAGGTVNGFSNAAYGAGAGGSVTGDANVAIGLNAGRTITASNTVAVGTNASASRNGAVALGFAARATKPQAVAIGQGSVADLANTVSVASAGNARRIVNVVDGVNPTDAVNLGQLQALLPAQAPRANPTGSVDRAHSEALLPAANASAAAPRPAAAADPTGRRLIDHARRELADLRAIVRRQQDEIARQRQEIAQLRSRKVTTVHATRE